MKKQKRKLLKKKEENKNRINCLIERYEEFKSDESPDFFNNSIKYSKWSTFSGGQFVFEAMIAFCS